MRVGFWRGRKSLWRGKPLFANFKKTRERFWGVLKSFICLILKFPQIGGFWGLNIQIDNFTLIKIQNSNFRHDQIIIIFFFYKNNLFKTIYFCKTTYYDLFSKNNLFKTTYLSKTAYSDLFSKNSLFIQRDRNKLFCINKLYLKKRS